MAAPSHDNWDPRQQKAREEFERMREQMRRNVERTLDLAAERERLAIALTASGRAENSRFVWLRRGARTVAGVFSRSRMIQIAAAAAAAFVAGVISTMLLVPGVLSGADPANEGGALQADATPSQAAPAERPAPQATAATDSAPEPSPIQAGVTAPPAVDEPVVAAAPPPNTAGGALEAPQPGEPVTEELVSGALVAEEPVVAEPVAEDPVVADPARAELVAESSSPDLAAADAPATPAAPSASTPVLAAAETEGGETVIDRVARVRDTQTLLAEMGYPIGRADGDAGPQTLAAAAAFAAERRLADANLDAALLAAAQSAAASGHRAGDALPEPEDPVLIRVERVRDIQTSLAAMGFPIGRPDGDPGPQTRTAIASFVAARGLYDVNIDDALVAAMRAAADDGFTAANAAAAPVDPVLARVARIREAQALLASMGYEPGRADGDPGPQTLTAIATFAASRGVASTAIDDALIRELTAAAAAGHRAGPTLAPMQPNAGVATGAERDGSR